MRICVVCLVVVCLAGCANRLNSSFAPENSSKITPVTRIGVSGPGATMASSAFLEAGYDVTDMGSDSDTALGSAKAQGVPFVAVTDSTDSEGSWWDGFFSFGMRVTETSGGRIVWSANADYGSGGLTINQSSSTQKAMRDMVKDFARQFPPANPPSKTTTRH